MNIAHKAIQLFIVILWLATSFWVYSYYSSQQNDKVNAIKLRPLSVSNWVNLADEYHQSKNIEKRSVALQVANSLAERRSVFTRPIWHRHIAWSEFDQARSSGSRLINLDAKETYDVFLVMKSIYGVKDFLNNIIPKDLVNEKHDKLTHISELVSTLIKNQRTIDLLELWDQLDNQTKTDIAQSRYMLNHYQTLSRNKKFGTIDSLSTTPKSNRQFNGSDLIIPFKKNDSQNPFCWIQSIQNNTQVSNVNNILSLSLLPVNSANSTFICYIPVFVEQKTSVNISSHWSSQKLSDNQTTSLSINLINNGNKTKPFRKVKKGSWLPENITYETIIDKNTLGIEIIFSMPNTRLNLTSGQISITNFSIMPISKN